MLRLQDQQKLVYLQKEDRIWSVTRKEYEQLTPEQHAEIKRLSRDEALEIALNDVNPHFRYILGLRFFGMYLNSHHDQLEEFFLRTRLESPPNYMVIKDNILKDIVREKFHMNQRYKLFDIYSNGDVRLRRNVPNKEAIPIIKSILLDIVNPYEVRDKRLIKVLKPETKLIMSKLNELEDRLNSIRRSYVEEGIFSENPTVLSNLQKINELREKLYGTAPLWWD